MFENKLVMDVIKQKQRRLLADAFTPVCTYLKVRDRYPGSILLESTDYRVNDRNFSYICLMPIAGYVVNGGRIKMEYPGGKIVENEVNSPDDVANSFSRFIREFAGQVDQMPGINGFFGHTSYDAVQYFEDIRLRNRLAENAEIDQMRYHFYQYIIAFNHYNDEVLITENLPEGCKGRMDEIEGLIRSRNYATFPFSPEGNEESEISDERYMEMVALGKQHCQRGDVFQIVPSRRYSQAFKGDDFNVYRALRTINPSPYLFYFDYGNYKLFGSSPEAQLVIRDGRAIINPIAGTFRRSGSEKKDRGTAARLLEDPKENAEHVMLVDLARNDLSRNGSDLKVDIYREVQYYSHVIHLVSEVSGKLHDKANMIRIMGDTFPAGTLTGAPKYRAMELINEMEPHLRGFYGGGIGYIGLNGELNLAIMIRTFLSRANKLYYQAGAGVVSESDERSELQEVNNKLGALKKAVLEAKEIG